jgi:hypothetical protein
MGRFGDVNSNAEYALNNNLSAIVAPTVNDDALAGYEPGSLWVDKTGDAAYVCVDATAGAAIWTSATLPVSNAYGLYSQTANSVRVQGTTNNGGTLFGSGVGSLSVPANFFKVGDSFKLDGEGHLTHPAPAASNELKIEVKFNGVVELTIDIDMPIITDLHWNMELNFTVRSIGATGSVMTGMKFLHEEDAADKFVGHSITQLSSLNTTIANTLDVVATWGSTDDSNEIYSEIMNLHKIY